MPGDDERLPGDGLGPANAAANLNCMCCKASAPTVEFLDEEAHGPSGGEVHGRMLAIAILPHPDLIPGALSKV